MPDLINTSMGDTPLYSQNQVTILDVKRSYELMDTQQKAMLKQLDTIQYALLGNGDPSKGMIVRVEKLEALEIATAKWHDQVDRRFLYSFFFQVVLFLMEVVLAGIFI